MSSALRSQGGQFPNIAAVSLVMLAVAAIACFFPASPAMRVDPIVNLRYE